MKLTNKEIVFFALLVVEFSICFFTLEHFSIFQFMLFVQIIPSILLAFISGNIAVKHKHTWLILISFGIIHALMMFAIFSVTPMTIIEQNTIQSETSVFTFNRNLQFGTYFGFFLQELLLGGFIAILSKTFRKVKQGQF